MDPSWTYFLILVLSMLYPLAQSFEKRVYMYQKARFIFPGMLVTGAIYLVWDIWFTGAGIWGFNHNYTRDLYLAGLPLEEWLFFLVVPYCCIFLYEVLRLFIRRFYFPVSSRIIITILLTLLLGSIPFIYQRTYTVTAVTFASFMLLLQLLQKTYRSWFSGFLLAYLISLVPFLLVNGVLTSIPVVWYNNAENLGIRVYTVPVEDFIYLFGLLLPSVNIYQLLLHRFASQKLREKMKLQEITGF